MQVSRNDVASFAWHGWRLELPPEWNPVKLEGDYEKGYALLADIDRPRLGLRWDTPKKNKAFEPAKWADKALREEVGELAAKEAKRLAAGEDFAASMLYVEPEPPGRDVWLAFSRVSGRVVEVIYHAESRDTVLARSILPTLRDAKTDRDMAWSVFDLSCVVPRGMLLESRRFAAGDATMVFADKIRRIGIRQIAPASLALHRLNLEQWLGQQVRAKRKHYRPAGEAEPVRIETVGRRELIGFSRKLTRRRRFALARSLAKSWTVWALHDATRDRLVLIDGGDESLASEVTRTIGWAGT